MLRALASLFSRPKPDPWLVAFDATTSLILHELATNPAARKRVHAAFRASGVTVEEAQRGFTMLGQSCARGRIGRPLLGEVSETA